MNTFTTWLTVLMLAIFTVMVGVALQYPTGAQFMPLVVGIPGIVLCLIQLAQDYVGSRKGQLAAQFHSEPRAGVPAPVEEEPEFGPDTIRNEIIMWAYFLGFTASLILFGFTISVPIMVALYLYREAKAPLVASILSGLAAGAVMYLLFEYVLRLQLHPGFITQWVTRALGS